MSRRDPVRYHRRPRDEDIHATFFAPGWTVGNYTDKVEAVRAAGHEIAGSFIVHESGDDNTPAVS